MVKELAPKETLTRTGLVTEEGVVDVLSKGVPLSRAQILESLGFGVRIPDEEIKAMGEVKKRRKADGVTMFDNDTSARLELDEVIIKMKEAKIITSAISREGGRDGVRYYLASQRDELISGGVIYSVDSTNIKDFIDEEARFFFEVGFKYPRGKRKYSSQV